MSHISLEDIEFIKILANSDSFILQKTTVLANIEDLEAKIGDILRNYYREKTMGENNGFAKKLESFGITEDEGKAAIACARRIGIKIF